MMTHSTPQQQAEKIAIIDIGSNNIRMGVYAHTLPLQLLHLEGNRCGLGQDLARTGALHPDGCTIALEYIPNLYTLALEMGCTCIVAVATAALRNATDAKDFLNTLSTICPLKIDVITGETEAYLSALGATHTLEKPQGIVADLGGGSMDIANVDYTKDTPIFGTTSIPFGALSWGKNPTLGTIKPLIKQAIANYIDFVSCQDFKTLYVVGGILRAIVSQYIYDKDESVRLLSKSERKKHLHGITVPRDDMLAFLKTILKKQRPIYTLYEINEGRFPYIIPSCYMLKRLIQKSNISHVTACTSGLRDGVFLNTMQDK